MEQLGVDYCLCPEASAIYHDNYCYRIEETQQALILEGVKRPGHFNGVLTVVMKLLNLVKPHRSYFGEKDYQQYILIRDMARAFFLDTDVILCPTIRESSGLACSSRNSRLNPEERMLADKFAEIFHQSKSCEAIKRELIQEGIVVDYIEDYEQRRFAAVLIGPVRLIDNYAFVFNK
jgi:pantoate--beta-alanine ligase